MTAAAAHRRGLQWALTAAAAVLLILAARRVDWSETWRTLRAASLPLLAAATALNLASLAARGARWWVFLRGAGTVPLDLAVRATVVGSGLNNLLLANGGEAARVVLVARRTGLRASEVLATLALERLCGLLGYFVMLVAATWHLPLPEAAERVRRPAALALVLLAGLAGVLLVWTPVGAGREGAFGDARPSPLARVRAGAAAFLRQLGHLSSTGRVAAALLLTVADWGGQFATYHLAARAAHFPVSPAATAAALVAVNVGFLLQLTPGSVGVFQAVYATTLAAFGLSREAAVATALLIQAVQIIPVTLLAFAFAPRLVLHPPRTRLPDAATD